MKTIETKVYLFDELSDDAKETAREYEYQNSNECVDETICANEYTFTETGERFG